MKLNIIIKVGILISCFVLLVMMGCSYDAPDSPWEVATKKVVVQPVITSIDPSDAGSASQITIKGENFSTDISKNTVYFDNVVARIISCSSTQIVVYRPNIVGESLTVKVLVSGATEVAKFPGYKLVSVVDKFGVFIDSDAQVVFATDANEYNYIILADAAQTVIKLDPQGKRVESFQATGSKFATDMKMGANGYLYYVRKQEQVYRIAPTGGEAEKWVKFASGGKAKCLDFDENGNMYAGGEKTGLLVARPDMSFANLGFYKASDIQAVRVYNGYVYVALTTGIWKNQILSNTGTLKEGELLLDWATTGDYASSLISSMAISESGTIVIATNDTLVNAPIMTFKEGGSPTPLFLGLIISPVDQIIWGSGNYLYALINRRVRKDEGGDFVRITMDEKSAPYYGR
jgi:hypothetical protein